MTRPPALRALLTLTALGAMLLPAAARAQAASADAVPAPRSAEPQVQRTVIEDDQVRIEELKVRGVVQSVTVQPRNSRAPAYRILPAEGGRDLSRERVPAGQRVWSVMSF